MVGLIVFKIGVCAQGFTEVLDSDYLQLRVKTIEDFINRFNYSQDAHGNFLEYHDSLRNDRVKEILYLFSKKLLKENYKNCILDNMLNDTSKNNVIKTFIDTVTKTKHNKYIDLVDTEWYAEIIYNASYFKKKEPVTLFMSLKYDDEFAGISWFVDSCRASFLKIIPDDTLRVSPVSHNMNFMHVSKLMKYNYRNISSIASKKFRSDILSILFYEIYNKRLILNNIDNVKFHFKQISGFYFVVEELKSEEQHSGWLITKINKIH